MTATLPTCPREDCTAACDHTHVLTTGKPYPCFLQVVLAPGVRGLHEAEQERRDDHVVLPAGLSYGDRTLTSGLPENRERRWLNGHRAIWSDAAPSVGIHTHYAAGGGCVTHYCHGCEET